jgi:dTDP-4-amino-4,6-dideoxygalactose transaminase
MHAQYQYLEVGTNARMSEVQAAIGRVQLKRLPRLVEARRKNAARYLSDLASLDWLNLPSVPQGRTHAWNQFTVQVNHGTSRDDVIAHLAARGVPTAVYYPALVPDLPLYRDHPLVDGTADCPRAKAATTSVFSLPIHPDLSDTDLDRTVQALLDFRP